VTVRSPHCPAYGEVREPLRENSGSAGSADTPDGPDRTANLDLPSVAGRVLGVRLWAKKELTTPCDVTYSLQDMGRKRSEWFLILQVEPVIRK
jgi:hypothetical protein